MGPVCLDLWMYKQCFLLENTVHTLKNSVVSVELCFCLKNSAFHDKHCFTFF